MWNTTLCYIERQGQYLMLHRVKKENDINKDKWIGIGGKFEDQADFIDCDEGDLEWVDKDKVKDLPIWTGDKIFLDLLNQDVPFFSLKLSYVGDTLVEAVLNGKAIGTEV